MELPNKLLANDQVGDSGFGPNGQMAQQANGPSMNGQDDELSDQYKSVRIFADQLLRIDDWRSDKRPIPSRLSAVRQLLNLGMKYRPVDLVEDL
jgi:hypothetical protein